MFDDAPRRAHTACIAMVRSHLRGRGVALVIAATAFFLRPWDPVRTQVVQNGFDHPWDIVFAAEGRMLVTERIGRVRV
ncbi:MAG: PQQ-dependent sugar dehydrogenase [Chloroflexota bacterium]|nr:PQQ-dependent sugar dehydrogenase [Chloroflexota bacterium]